MGETSVTVKWTGDMQFVGTDSGRHSVVMSSHDEANHTGVRPSEMLLLALGACSVYDVVSILRKKRLDLQDLKMVVSGEQDPEPPRTFRRIHLEYHLKGTNLTEKHVGQAIELSVEKYCSVAATVSGRAEITHAFVIANEPA